MNTYFVLVCTVVCYQTYLLHDNVECKTPDLCGRCSRTLPNVAIYQSRRRAGKHIPATSEK